MKVITEPNVTVVGVTQFFDHPQYKIPTDGTPLERLGAFAAKGCYDSYLPKGRPNRDNQRDIIEQRHGSVAEHATVSLFIEGITRACSHEVVRHRHFSYSQRSTRYVAEEDGAIVLEPFLSQLWKEYEFAFDGKGVLWGRAEDGAKYPFNTDLHSYEPGARIVGRHVQKSLDALLEYRQEVEELMAWNPEGRSGFALRKWARGKARNVLPHNVETRLTMTGNIRAWRHFIEERSGRGAEPEIRRLANKVVEAISPLAPVYFEDYQVELVDGFYEYATDFRKV